MESKLSSFAEGKSMGEPKVRKLKGMTIGGKQSTLMPAPKKPKVKLQKPEQRPGWDSRQLPKTYSF